MNLRCSVEVLRKLGILAVVLLAFKQSTQAVESPANSDDGGPKVDLNADEKSYEQAAAEQEAYEKAEIDRLSIKVAELNTKAGQEGKRRAELQEVVDKGAPGSAKAIGELQILRKGIAAKERDEYILLLKARQVEISKNLAATEAKLKKLQSSRGSWFSNERDLDAEELKFARWRDSLNSAARINNILLRRLESGVTSFASSSSSPLSDEELQERFFPTR